MQDNKRYLDKVPCVLCHFCVKTDLETHGSVCVWFDAYIPVDEVKAGDGCLRKVCREDKGGDNFTWRMDGVGALDYVRWRQSLVQLSSLRTRTTLAVAVSVASFAIAAINFWLKVQ